MDKLIIDPEFRDKIPPLMEEEFTLLEENILSDGGGLFTPHCLGQHHSGRSQPL